MPERASWHNWLYRYVQLCQLDAVRSDKSGLVSKLGFFGGTEGASFTRKPLSSPFASTDR